MRLTDIQGCFIYLEIKKFELSLGNELAWFSCPVNDKRLAMGKQVRFRVDESISVEIPDGRMETSKANSFPQCS